MVTGFCLLLLQACLAGWILMLRWFAHISLSLNSQTGAVMKRCSVDSNFQACAVLTSLWAGSLLAVGFCGCAAADGEPAHRLVQCWSGCPSWFVLFATGTISGADLYFIFDRLDLLMKESTSTPMNMLLISMPQVSYPFTPKIKKYIFLQREK